MRRGPVAVQGLIDVMNLMDPDFEQLPRNEAVFRICGAKVVEWILVAFRACLRASPLSPQALLRQLYNAQVATFQFEVAAFGGGGGALRQEMAAQMAEIGRAWQVMYAHALGLD